MANRVTLKTIAARAGVHLSTVSLALNNDPRIPEATSLRIKSLADEMGYRRDPMLSALIAYRASNQSVTEKSVLAWVDLWTDSTGARGSHGKLWDGAFEQATQLGWKLEEFRPLYDGLTLQQFSRILSARGIQGLIIAPLPEGINSIELEWPLFSAVTPSRSLHNPRLHSIVTNQSYNMGQLCQKLYDCGYRKPGFVIVTDENNRIGHDWLSAFLGFQYLRKDLTVIPILEQAEFNDEVFISWMKTYRPDVIIATRATQCITALTDAGFNIPNDIGVVSTRSPGDFGPDSIWGVDEHFDKLGAHTVNVLVGMLHRNERGVPLEPRCTLVNGGLHAGESLRTLMV